MLRGNLSNTYGKHKCCVGTYGKRKENTYVSKTNKRVPIQTHVFPYACLFVFERACLKQKDVIVSKKKSRVPTKHTYFHTRVYFI